LPNHFDPEHINRGAAELSRDFFVAAQATERESRYSNFLGVRAEYIEASEVSDLLR
jgi:hypothetical protein